MATGNNLRVTVNSNDQAIGYGQAPETVYSAPSTATPAPSGGNYTARNADGSTTTYNNGVPTTTPAAGSSTNSSGTNTGTTGASSPSTALPSSSAPGGGPDNLYSTASNDLNPSQPQSEDDFFDQLYKQFTPVISAINSAEASAESAAYATAANDQSAANYGLNSEGLAGSSEAQGMATQNARNAAQGVATAKAAQATAISNAFTYLTGQAHTEFTDAQTRGDTLDANYVANMQSTALSTVKGLAESGITSATDLQSKDPKAYASLLQYYNNDPDALNSALVMNQPNNKIVQSWTNGSNYYQLVTDPITGKPVVQTTDLGVTPPTGWSPQKISNTTVLFQDPNNPANTVIYTTDPISGAVNVTGTGTGATVASQYNAASGSSTASSTSSSTGSTGETASSTVATALGVDPSTPLSDVIANQGIGAVVAAMMKNEGGSPAGVSNNPGNIKFTGAAGQTDSGVKATDGGTFASYATPQAGQDAIASVLTDAASGTSSAYGPAPTLASAVDTYTNTGSQGANQTASGLPTAEYGLLANVAGFNPNATGDKGIIDRDAYSYLKLYMSGTQPTNTNLTGKRAASSSEFQQAQQRAQDLYFQATGKQLPNITTLSGNLGFLNANNSLLNSLAVQEGTISANSDLLQGNITADNINKNAPIINDVIDGIQNALGDPGTASYLAQNSTLSNELGSLLALKNASGTTVHDKLISADLISPDATGEQEAAVVNTLMQEAQNAHTAISMANAKLYSQTDPLGLDPNNPLSDPSTFAQSIGFDLSTAQQDYPDMTPQQIIESYINSQ